MQVILLERVERLGAIGDVVTVKNGYARNFLFPRSKAMRATAANLEDIALRKAELEAENEARKSAAEKVVAKINGLMVNLIRQAGEDGRLYGSVTSRDIANCINATGKAEVRHDMIVLNSKFKDIGIYSVDVMLHPEVKAVISLNIARSEEEAKHASVATPVSLEEKGQPEEKKVAKKKSKDPKKETSKE
jgi:large subunit ribosomal protein L9